MKRPLAIGTVGAALAAMLSGVVAHSEELPLTQVAQAADAYAPRYDFGPRIIHVPQPDEEDAADAPDRRAMPDADDDAEPTPPPRRQSVPRPRPQTSSDAPPAPRRRPYTAAKHAEPASVERRTVLSAPIHDRPTPIRPIPRFVKESGEKFAPSPPPAYTPPSNVPAAPVSQAPATDAGPAGPQEPAPPSDAPISE